MGRTRSQQMARIKGKNTSPELRLRRALWAAGLRYRIHYPTPGGRADIALVKAKLAVYLDGCFFHGCPQHYVRPRSRVDFWSAKLAENVQRDRRQTLNLEAAGWRVCRVWEHEVFEILDAVVERVRQLSLAHGDEPALAWRVVKAEPIPGSERLELWTLQDLRDPSCQQVIERVRTTGKWKQPDPA
jgi:DNA mismatch endonuclease (patch repair protein)